METQPERLSLTDFQNVVEKIVEKMPDGQEAQIQEQENSRKALLFKELYQQSNVPKRHADFKKEISINKKWNESLSTVFKKINTGSIVVLFGTRGSGKTQLGVCAIQEACNRGIKSTYIKATDLFLNMRASYKSDDRTEIEVVREFCIPGLLVIDCLENRSDSDFENLLLNHVIDKRYDAMVDTILITNETEEGFSKSMGASIVSRIHETGDKIICDWKSFREKN